MKIKYLKVMIPDEMELSVIFGKNEHNTIVDKLDYEEIDLHVLLKKQRELCTLNKVNEHMYEVVTTTAILNSPEPELP
jgi:hypothetical protein